MRRKQVTEIIALVYTPEIILLTGARQVGKTTAMLQVHEQLRSTGLDAHFFTLEDPDYLLLLNQHPDQLWRIVPKPIDGKTVVIIDEIQYLAKPSNFLKYHYDLNRDKLKLIVTGSSAFYLDERFNDSLAGRKRVLLMPTLSFDEYLRFKGDTSLAECFEQAAITEPDLSNLSIPQQREIFRYWDDYIIYGGYPAVVLASDSREKERLLNEILSSYTKRDFLESGIQVPDKAYQLMRILAHQSGSELNRSKLSVELGVARSSVDTMLRILLKSFHVSLLNPFFGGHPKELRKMPKLYYLDHGLRNCLCKNYLSIEGRMDTGRLFESYVYRHFFERKGPEELRYWRNQQQQEVDFIVSEQAAYEVKWNGDAIQTSKYQSFSKLHPNLPLRYIVRRNPGEDCLLF